MNLGVVIAFISFITLASLLLILVRGLFIMYKSQYIKKGVKTLKVSKLQFESQEIITFRLRRFFYLPLPTFLSGQYVTLLLPISKNKTIKRAYSIASWHKKPFYYELGIKKEELGIGTSWIFENLKNNSKLNVKLPQGHFYKDNFSNSSTVYIAGGIGITPLRSMLQASIKANGIAHQSYLLYACRYEEQLTYHQEFVALSNQFPNLKYIPILSQPNENWLGEKGRITIDLLKNNIVEFNKSEFYLCASKSLIETITDQLELFEIPTENIHFELFGNTPSQAITTTHTINYGNQSVVFDNYPTLYHAIEDLQIPIDGECRAGTCGNCKIKVKSGKVSYLINSTIPLENDEILPCCAIPIEDIYI
jgi:ferredoxin-NADP reductase